MEYLGLWVTRNCVKSPHKKSKAINNMTPPTTHKRVHNFMGLVNYYLDIWEIFSNIL